MTILFSGRVQGVGFRYTTNRISKGFNVTGFVRNVWDGNVELIAEGIEEELIDFIYAICNSELDKSILKHQVSGNKPTGEFDKFGISF